MGNRDRSYLTINCKVIYERSSTTHGHEIHQAALYIVGDGSQFFTLPTPPGSALRDRAWNNAAERVLELGAAAANVFAEASSNTSSVLEEQRSLHRTVRLEESPSTRSAKPALKGACAILDVFQRSAGTQFSKATARTVPVGCQMVCASDVTSAELRNTWARMHARE